MAEIIPLPGQKYNNLQPEEENLNTPAELHEPTDEITNIKSMTCKLFKTIAKEINKLENICRPAGDYERLLKIIEEDEEDITNEILTTSSSIAPSSLIHGSYGIQ